jgi:hypothetical protein
LHFLQNLLKLCTSPDACFAFVSSPHFLLNYFFNSRKEEFRNAWKLTYHIFSVLETKHDLDFLNINLKVEVEKREKKNYRIHAKKIFAYVWKFMLHKFEYKSLFSNPVNGGLFEEYTQKRT